MEASTNTNKKATMYRVEWTPSERRVIAQAALDCLDANPDLNGLPLFNTAQEVLHETRRRDIRTIKMVPWFAGLLNKMRAEREAKLDALLANRAATQPQAPALPMAQAAPTPAPLSTDDLLFREMAARVSPFLAPVIDASIKAALTSPEFLATLRPVAEAVLREAAPAAISQALPPPPKPVPAQPTPPTLAEIEWMMRSVLGGMLADTGQQQPAKSKRKKRPVVVLIGLKHNQFNAINEDFGDAYDFRLWHNAEDTIDRLKSLCSQAHRIFGMTNFMQHDADEAAMAVNKHAYKRFSGGVSTLRSLIEDMIAETA